MKVMIDPNLPQHRKVRKLGTLLEITPQAAIGHLVSLWCQVIQETENGNLADWDSADIATAAGWAGDHATFTKALQTCKLLDRRGAGYEIHEWIDHQGDLLRIREQGRERVRKFREKQDSSNGVTRNKRVTVTLGNARNAPPILSSPILALPSPSLPEESHKNDSCAETAKTPLPASEIPKALRDLQLYAADPKLVGQYPALVMTWRAAFPGVNIEAEIAKAHAWEMANPTRRKINRSRFLNTWLANKQDSPRNGNGQHQDAPLLSTTDLLKNMKEPRL